MNEHRSSPSERFRRIAASLAGFAVLSVPLLRGQQPSSADQTVPPYVFNGAYASYRISSGSTSQPYAIIISNVDAAHRSFQIAAQVGKVPTPELSSSRQASFDQESFLALRPSELLETQENIVPASLNAPQARLTQDVAVSVPAGKFSTEEIAFGDVTRWYDSRSGFLVKSIGTPDWTAILGGFGLTANPPTSTPMIQLVSTNIPMSPPPKTPLSVWIMYAAGVVLVVGLVVLSVYLVRRPRRESRSAVAKPVAVAAGSGVTVAALDRIAKLKSMLDQGLITREDFDKEKVRILGS